MSRLDTETTKAPEAKKSYVTPCLIVHGSLEEITHGVAGANTDTLGGSAVPSDRNIKQDFAEIDTREILAEVANLPITTWSYIEQGSSIRHIGPMAQDFAAAFNVGEDDRHINMVDASGVALAAIQALREMVLQQDARLGALQDELSSLKLRLAEREGALPGVGAR